ncbi:MAG: lysophospholipase [Anaerolineaceae bacterium]|nr:MAG: lysophospholipase [Anaerolineaceae bacterium]
MQHKQDQLIASDGVQLYWRAWEPDVPARATVCLVHGLGEHSGRYEHVAAAFTGAGLAVHAIDLRGHGRSEGPRGHTPGLAQWYDDIDLLLSRTNPEKARILYGHSLGATLVLSCGLHRPEKLNGVLATGPALRISADVPAVKAFLGKVMAGVWPTFSQPSGLIAADLSQDPLIVQAYIDDPLVHDRVSSRLYVDMLAAGEEMLKRAADFHLPVFLIHAETDRLCDHTATEEFYATVGSPDKTLHIWPALFHEVHNEPEKDQVIREMVEWVLAHI